MVRNVMAEYIEREAAIEICEAEYQARLRMCDYCGDTVAWNIGSEIKALPAADVAPVVRCRDCKYWQDNNDGYPHEECRWGHGETPDANDFCSYLERREERKT